MTLGCPSPSGLQGDPSCLANVARWQMIGRTFKKSSWCELKSRLFSDLLFAQGCKTFSSAPSFDILPLHIHYADLHYIELYFLLPPIYWYFVSIFIWSVNKLSFSLNLTLCGLPIYVISTSSHVDVTQSRLRLLQRWKWPETLVCIQIHSLLFYSYI